MTIADLVPCIPMKARLAVHECVRLHDSGEQPSCQGCKLGPERGAKIRWERRQHVDLSFWKTRGKRPQRKLAKPAAGAPPIAKWVREARISLGMSQRVFAVAVGRGQETVSGWEVGRRVPSEQDRKAIAALMEGE